MEEALFEAYTKRRLPPDFSTPPTRCSAVLRGVLRVPVLRGDFSFADRARGPVACESLRATGLLRPWVLSSSTCSAFTFSWRLRVCRWLWSLRKRDKGRQSGRPGDRQATLNCPAARRFIPKIGNGGQLGSAITW